MNILLIYATNSGGTFLASEIVQNTLTSHNHTVTVKNVREADLGELANFDAIIFGSPSWDYEGKQGMPHEDYLPFLEKAQGKTFAGKPFAIFGLGDRSFTYFTGAVDHLEEFVKKLQGKLIMESLRIDGFFFNQEANSKLVADWAEKLASAIA